MKLKMFAVFVALLFVGTATLASAVTDDGAKPVPPTKRFSGKWGVTFFDPCEHRMKNPQLGRVKGVIKSETARKIIVKGFLCVDGKCNDPTGAIFRIKLIKDRTQCGKMLHGVFKGILKAQWDCTKIGDCDCDYNADDCHCYEHDYYAICCSKSKAPFTGDWFIYHGWLMIMGTIHAYYNGEYDHKVWIKAYIGSWSYPGIECYP